MTDEPKQYAITDKGRRLALWAVRFYMAIVVGAIVVSCAGGGVAGWLLRGAVR